MTQKTIIIWYRNDLRLHDHEPLDRACQEKAQIIPIYCFDPRQFTTTSFGFPKTGKYRAHFIFAFGSKSEIGSRDVSRFFTNKLIG